MGPRAMDPSRRRDIIIRIHLYVVKDLLSQKSWNNGPFCHLEISVTIPPDLSRATLQCWALIHGRSTGRYGEGSGLCLSLEIPLPLNCETGTAPSSWEIHPNCRTCLLFWNPSWSKSLTSWCSSQLRHGVPGNLRKLWAAEENGEIYPQRREIALFRWGGDLNNR